MHTGCTGRECFACGTCVNYIGRFPPNLITTERAYCLLLILSFPSKNVQAEVPMSATVKMGYMGEQVHEMCVCVCVCACVRACVCVPLCVCACFFGYVH
jgi:hypothetical protein